ncbi:GNAT family N-acetyltransferase [Mangrovihabitans endophyticus]|uniref:Acetyltransferase n=1 Tax=Mangrovihabitans endophyticus TaxID=1751298 RepID=A0A8J3FL67_9ACTN|nr:GNAT family N-acetyltransferase [Mangrovihabitans endophyticus]GGK71481.1 acetyltransferase [Mangrovihabitans endophyticus]
MIRTYRPADLDTVYDICVRTADSGGDARGMYSDDRLMGDLFAAPYVTLEPERARILDDGDGTPVGYVVGTADSAGFARRYRDEWIPALRRPLPPDPPVTREHRMLWMHHHPERMAVPELADYPAHLHIDLLPPWQGRGLGRKLMASFLAGLHDAGVARVHLGMAPDNTGARTFYHRLGFTELPVGDSGVIYLGRDTRPL